MARRRRKKKSLSGLGALAIDPKIMLGGLLIVGVAAYFLLRKKDEEPVAAPMLPQDSMMPQDAMDTGSTGTPVDTAPAPAPAPSTPSSPLPPTIQQNPVVRERLRNLNIGKRTSRTSALVNNLFNR